MRQGALLMATALVALAGGLDAQTPTSGWLPGSTRAAAMGGAFGLGGPEAEAVFYNAAAAVPRGFGAAAQRAEGAWSLLSMAAGAEWLSGTVGLGVVAVSGADAEGSAAAGSAAELGGVLAYARRVGPLRLAAGGRVLERRAGGAGDLGGGFDVAVAHRLGPVWLGVAGQALGAGALSGEGRPLASALRIDAASRARPVGPLDVAGAATAGVREGGKPEAGAGVEVAWWPLVGRTFIARAGARVPEGGALSPTLGAAFHGDDIVLEYAWDEATSSHRLGIGWR